jgi:hypothetical protein
MGFFLRVFVGGKLFENLRLKATLNESHICFTDFIRNLFKTSNGFIFRVLPTIRAGAKRGQIASRVWLF